MVYADGHTVGTIGGGCYENDAAGKAREAMRPQRPLLARYDLDDDVAAESGLIRGGTWIVFIEPIESAPHLHAGGRRPHRPARRARRARGGLSRPRRRLARSSPIPTVSRRPIAGPTSPALASATLEPRSYAVIARGHRHDLDAPGCSPGGAEALGLIGSRAKVKRCLEALGEEGPERTRWLRTAPIGLDIGAVTPAEIA
jgi:xanthine dehydrogenase accessory factor